MPLFEIKAPDGRILRQDHPSLDDLKARLLPGYSIIGRVYGVLQDQAGGLVEPAEGPSLMSELLAAHGDELVAWLKEHLTP